MYLCFVDMICVFVCLGLSQWISKKHVLALSVRAHLGAFLLFFTSYFTCKTLFFFNLNTLPLHQTENSFPSSSLHGYSTAITLPTTFSSNEGTDFCCLSEYPLLIPFAFGSSCNFYAFPLTTSSSNKHDASVLAISGTNMPNTHNFFFHW